MSNFQTLYDSCSIVEGFCDYEPTQEEQILAWSHLIRTGAAWSLQGWYGRTASALIDQGILDLNGDILIEI